VSSTMPIVSRLHCRATRTCLTVTSFLLFACSARVGKRQRIDEGALTAALVESLGHGESEELEELIEASECTISLTEHDGKPRNSGGRCRALGCIAPREWGGSIEDAIEGTWCSCAGNWLVSIHGSSFQFCSSSGCGMPDHFTVRKAELSAEYIIQGSRSSITIYDPRELSREIPGLLIVKFRHQEDDYYLSRTTDCSCFASAMNQGFPSAKTQAPDPAEVPPERNPSP
jgi:hypothetical protein